MKYRSNSYSSCPLNLSNGVVRGRLWFAGTLPMALLLMWPSAAAAQSTLDFDTFAECLERYDDIEISRPMRPDGDQPIRVVVTGVVDEINAPGFALRYFCDNDLSIEVIKGVESRLLEGFRDYLSAKRTVISSCSARIDNEIRITKITGTLDGLGISDCVNFYRHFDPADEVRRCEVAPDAVQRLLEKIPELRRQSLSEHTYNKAQVDFLNRDTYDVVAVRAGAGYRLLDNHKLLGLVRSHFLAQVVGRLIERQITEVFDGSSISGWVPQLSPQRQSKLCGPRVRRAMATLSFSVTLELNPVRTPPVNSPMPPVAVDDFARTIIGESVFKENDNDFDQDGSVEDLRFEILTPPAYGEIEEYDETTGNFTYRPHDDAPLEDVDAPLEDIFTYQTTDPDGLSDTATVTIFIFPPPHIPPPPERLDSEQRCHTVTGGPGLGTPLGYDSMRTYGPYGSADIEWHPFSCLSDSDFSIVAAFNLGFHGEFLGGIPGQVFLGAGGGIRIRRWLRVGRRNPVQVGLGGEVRYMSLFRFLFEEHPQIDQRQQDNTVYFGPLLALRPIPSESEVSRLWFIELRGGLVVIEINSEQLVSGYLEFAVPLQRFTRPVRVRGRSR